MRSKTKNITMALLAASSAICLSGALALLGTSAVAAHAEENAGYYAFVNVGASTEAELIDEALDLTAKGATATVEGTVTQGGTLFTGYAENATYSFDLPAGTYQVAVAILAEEGTAVTVGGTPAQLPAGAAGKCVVSVSATVEGALTVAVEGKLCGVLIADENSKVLMTADYSAGQVIPYGAYLDDVLEGATGYYSDGSTAELAIEYESITASSGVNVNFTTVDVSGLVEGTNLRATRYVTTMPDDLVYFINSGSYDVDNQYGDGIDGCYSYNQTVFDYYGNQLLNDGTPDRNSSNSDAWGCYTNNVHSVPNDSTFPYNTLLWTDSAVDMGYYLADLTPNANYRIYIGTLSHWHARTVSISFNGAVVGADTLRINASKGYTVYENVPADANGKINLHMQGASTNEPCINFIAVQPMAVELSAVPSKLEGSSTIGLEDTSLTVTGVTEGAKLQLFNASKPNQVLYEEKVDAEKIASDGSYVIDWGRLLNGEVAQFNVVQITNGGVSEALLVSITDIEDFEIVTSPEGYTTGAVTITVKAHADSGIASWSYQLGEYGTVNAFVLERPYAVNESFSVTENGDYIVIVTSGLGVTYSETVSVRNIDPDRPVLAFTPSKEGWAKGAYNVTFSVQSIAPVTEYTLYQNGVQLVTAQSAPTTITFTEEGEYLISVKTAAGRSATGSICVSAKPTVTSVVKSYANRTLKFTFGNTEDYEVASVSAYEVKKNGVTRMTIASGNSMDVYNAGKYVVTVTTANGTVEMFALTVSASDLKVSSGSTGGAALGIGIGVGVGGIVIAAAAVTVTILLLKKKKNS